MRSIHHLATFLVAALSAVACASSSDSSTTGDQTANAIEESAQSFTFTCNADKDRIARDESNQFASFQLKLQGKNATLTSVVYTDSYKSNVQDQLKDEQDFLAKGVNFDGKPLTAKDRADAQDTINNLQKILDADGKLAFTAAIRRHVRKVKHPSAQYFLTVKTAGIDSDLLFGTLGNEGTFARLLVPPTMVEDESAPTGQGGKPDIEFEGDQGPGFDRYDCQK